MEPQVSFRFATPQDAELVLRFIRALADYEHLLDEVVATPQLLQEWLFEKKAAEVLFVLKDGKEAGYALFFHNFSTFLGRAGIYLEDLFVLPEHRHQGLGKALLKELARLTAERGCGRLEWACLNWNRPSIEFYLACGAVPMEEWTTYRLAGAALEAMAK